MRILFLHGIGDQAPHLRWLDDLNVRLRSIRRSPVTPDQVVAPSYFDKWESDAGAQIVAAASGSPSARYRFVARQAALDARLYAGRAYGDAAFFNDGAAELLAINRLRKLAQVKSFLAAPSHPTLLNTIREAIAEPAGDWIVVGHSLGSAVALEFVAGLPRHMNVRLLLTVGSPLGRSAFDGFRERHFPRIDFDSIGNWLNVLNSGDLVPGGRTLEKAVPHAVNLKIQGDPGDHTVGFCVARPEVSEEIGRALYGVRSTEVVPAPKEYGGGQYGDLLVMAGLQLGRRYVESAERILDGTIKASQLRRLGRARDENAAAAQETYASENRRAPADFTSDMSDVLRGRVSRRAASRLLVSLAESRPLSPFTFELTDRFRRSVDEAVARDALRRVACDLGLNSTFVDAAYAATAEAKKAFVKDGRWRLAAVAGLTVLGVGLVVMVPPLVAAAGPATAAGGAAFVGGLAALGPGGMAGGLMVLTGAAGMGGAGLGAAGRAIVRQSAAEVTQMAVELMAAARTAQALHLADSATSEEWQLLSWAADEAKKQYDRHAEVSDPESAGVKEAKRKHDQLQTALGWMREKGLAPREIEVAA